jgi:Uma2 family endonuclease
MQQETPKTALSALASAAPTDPDAFLVWSSHRKREEGKFELSRGQVKCVMIHASRAHARVCRNIILELGRLLDAERYDISSADFAVRSAFGIRSPDVVVDEANPHGRQLHTTTPIFIAEVLSPSTTGIDFIEKSEEYGSIESLQTYLICAQDEPRAWYWSRQADGSWPKKPMEIAGREGAISLGGLDIELSMAAIFRGIPDPPTLG